MAHLDLKAIERRAFRATFQDGLWDIFLGLTMMAFAFGALARALDASEQVSGGVHMGLVLVALAILTVGKRVITMPRIGYVRFGAERQRKLLKTRIILVLSALAGLVLFVLFATGNDTTLTVLMIVFGASVLIVFGAMAYYLDFERLYLYAVLWALSLPVGLWLEDEGILSDAGYVFFATGGLALVIGLVLFARFLRDYPLPEEGHVNGTV